MVSLISLKKLCPIHGDAVIKEAIYFNDAPEEYASMDVPQVAESINF